MRLLIAILLLAIPAMAQEAKVLALSPKDAEEVRYAYEKMLDAQSAWVIERAVMQKKYLTVSYDSPERGNHTYANSENGEGILTTFVSTDCHALSIGSETLEHNQHCLEVEEREKRDWQEREKHLSWWRKGWENADIEFSVDFRFIVPKSLSATSGTLTQGNCNPFIVPAYR